MPALAVKQQIIAAITSILVVLLTGCASAPSWPTQPASDQALDITKGHVLSDVPFFPQERYQCGPAALAMMLNTQGRDAKVESLVHKVYLPGREGTLQVELVAAARSYNLLVYPLKTQLSDVLTEVAAGNPVLVMQNLGFDWWPQWHFAVVIGFDPALDVVILHTDTRRANQQPLRAFMNTWQRADQWAVVMLPPDHLPATAEPVPFLTAANDLEVTGRLSAADAAYRTAASAWPAQPAAWLGRGNIAYQQERWQDAVEHYQQTVSRFPSMASGWNNLAYALSETSCQSAANKAMDCAARLDDERFDDNLKANDGVHRPADQCPELHCPVD
ncbi:PA2778 family cysteine peptidase [Marinobacter caseinilyticus]|uniref:PA2778 family cysteine peptidase n=1 Tax=Marinobacter caseinilyticus TaxID=2692195 RepID=UPI00140BD6BD|nr:PA2778 family cysteine peptidase [Marinobacter caseinilyticus]